MNKNVLIVTTVPSMIGLFNINNINILKDLGYKVHVATNFLDRSIWTDKQVNDLIEELNKLDVNMYNIPFKRNPFSIKNIKAFSILNKIVIDNNFKFIHCHAATTSVLSRIIGKLHNIKIIYTAHGFHFYKGAPFLNYIIFYPIEKFLSKWTDCLITINEEDFILAKNKFFQKNLYKVNGIGIDTNKFCRENDAKELNEIRKKLNIDLNNFVITIVGELNKNKNQKLLINSLSLFRKEDLDKIIVLIVGIGKNEITLKELAKKYKLTNIRFLSYRDDVIDILKITNLYVSTSIREGLPVSVMEAMSMGLPILALKNRGTSELIDENGGILVKKNNYKDFYKNLFLLFNDFYNKKQIIKKFSDYNLKKIKSYDTSIINNELIKIYESI